MAQCDILKEAKWGESCVPLALMHLSAATGGHQSTSWQLLTYALCPLQETQEFFRAKDPQYKKKVKVLESMEPCESRRYAT